MRKCRKEINTGLMISLFLFIVGCTAKQIGISDMSDSMIKIQSTPDDFGGWTELSKIKGLADSGCAKYHKKASFISEICLQWESVNYGYGGNGTITVVGGRGSCIVKQYLFTCDLKDKALNGIENNDQNQKDR